MHQFALHFLKHCKNFICTLYEFCIFGIIRFQVIYLRSHISNSINCFVRGIKLRNNGLMQIKLGLEIFLCRFDARIFGEFKILF